MGQQEPFELRGCGAPCWTLDQFDADSGAVRGARKRRHRHSPSGQYLGQRRTRLVEGGEVYIAPWLTQLVDPGMVDKTRSGSTAIGEKESGRTDGRRAQSRGQLVECRWSEPGPER